MTEAVIRSGRGKDVQRLQEVEALAGEAFRPLGLDAVVGGQPIGSGDSSD
ncbi:hypothetical protein [Pseudarthrobacter sp. NamE2]|nr:hypothetical protein [Pseudarthrobacter sp. NamE2]